MSHRALHAVILITGLITAIVHLVVLNIGIMQDKGQPDVLFTLNGLGYLVLLGVFFLIPGIVRQRRTLFHYAFIAFTAVTVLAWVVLGARNALGYFTKLDEVVLILALWQHLRSPE